MNSENQTGVQSPIIIHINLHIPEITITKKMRQGVKRILNVIYHEVDESIIDIWDHGINEFGKSDWCSKSYNYRYKFTYSRNYNFQKNASTR